MSVHKKLMQARLSLQASKITKSGHNKYAGYQYFELGDFIPTVQNIFDSIGLCGVVSYAADIATLTITDIETGTSLTVTSPMSSASLKGCHDVQNLGAVQTYIRRYLWVTAMEIVEHDALDATTGHTETKAKIGNIASSKQPLAGALDQFNTEELAALNEIASAIVDFANNEQWEDAFVTYDNIDDNEKRTAVWSILGPHSSIRARIKKIGEENRKKQLTKEN